MEALILAIIITYAIKKAVESSHLHWQSSKAANRKASRGRPLRNRAASALQHDAGYWAHQVLNGFPQARDGLAAGWHAGRTAQAQGTAARQQARTEHLEGLAGLLAEIRGQQRRQEEALERIRAARRPGPGPEGAETAAPAAPQSASSPPPEGGGTPVTPSTEGTAMSGDVTYTQQMAELQAIRRDAEEEANSARRKRMASRLDVLMSLGLDAATLSEAAAIDDALRAQEKAAQQVLDAADAAIAGLAKRHGGIKAAVDDAPVDRPAEPEFYQD